MKFVDINKINKYYQIYYFLLIKMIFYDIFVDIMYVDDYCPVINGKSYRRALIRESYREGKKVKKRTIANISHASDAQIQAIKLALRQSDEMVLLKNIGKGNFTSGIAVGAVAMLYQVAQHLGITKVLGKSRPALLFLWLVFARLIDQGSRLSAVRLAQQHAVCEILGLEGFNENDLYKAMDWGWANQKRIQSKLYSILSRDKQKMKGEKPFETVFLYDVTSTYLEGCQNELAAYGYNRDKKMGKRQIVYGLLTDQEGVPLAVEAFSGNTKDNKTLLSQIRKIKEDFGVNHVTVVGDKGMLKSMQISSINEEETLNYITSITKPQIRKLLEREVLTMELFEEKLCEVVDTQEGLRYVLRRNPRRVEEMKANRESKLYRVKKKVEWANTYLAEHPRAKVETQLKGIGTYLKKLKLSDYVGVVEGTGSQSRSVELEIDEEQLDQLSKLDGCYVIKTDLTKSKGLSKKVIHERYKALSEVEWAFRTEKTGYLEVRPIFVRKETRTRAHLLITMLAYRLEKVLRKSWNDIDLTVQEAIKRLAQITSVIIELREEKLHRVPKPDRLTQKLLQAVNVKLPGTLPLIENTVDTTVKLQNERKQGSTKGVH